MNESSRARWSQVLLAVASLGALLAVSGTVVGWRLAGRLQHGVDESLAVADDVLGTTDETLVVLGRVLDDVDRTIGTVEESVRLTAATVESSTEALDSLSGATPSIVTSMRSVRGDVERIAAVLGTVDSVLGNIGRLPGVPNYAPDQPLASTVLGLRPELDALIDGLVAVDTAVQQIDRDAGPLTARLATLRADLGALRTDVADAERLLAEYQGSTLEAQVLARRTRSGLARDLTETRVLVVLAGVVFLVGQVVPLTLRRLLLDAGPPVDPPVDPPADPPVDPPAPDRAADSPAER